MLERDIWVRIAREIKKLFPLFRSLIWILLGAAGVFIPLEGGHNRLWQVRADRPYWLNQIVGFTLTVVCVVLAIIFVAISTTFHFVVNILPFQVVRDAASYVVIHTTMTCFFIVTIFALYKFLPNKKVDAMQVLPAAILAGMIAELVRLIYALILPFVNLQDT